MVTKTKAVFLDRDGVIARPYIKKGKSISARKYKEFKLLPKVKEAIVKLKKNNFIIIVITNQPDISKGLLKLSEVKKMHQKLFANTLIDDIFLCPHDEINNCKCRKPKPGLLIKAIKKYNIDIAKSYLIGDRLKDIEAAENINLKSLFIKRNYHEPQPSKQLRTFHSLNMSVKYILYEL